MSQKMDMTVNRLPARTWNWLKMNETTLKQRTPCIEGSHEITHIGNGTTVAKPDPGMQELFKTVETGMGPDMDSLGEAIPADMIVQETGKATSGPVFIRAYTKAESVAFHKIYIYARKNSTLEVAFLHETDKEQHAVSALQVRVFAEEGATVRLYMAQLLDPASEVLCDVGYHLEEHASGELIRMEIGAKNTYTGVLADLCGKESRFRAQVGYRCRHGQHLDMNYVARHRGKGTVSRMDSAGVLEDNSFKLFRGTIDFVRGCVGAKGDEAEEVLLLGDDVVNQTIPLILCAEEDVEGNHGASIGSLDEKTMFYLTSRGFTQEEAEQMVARARIDALSEQIPVEEIRRKVNEAL